MPASPTLRPTACLVWIGLLAGGAVGQEPGEAHLRRAIEVRITAESLTELSEVIDSCQAALDAGLSPGDERFCREVLAAALFHRATAVAQVLGSARPHNLLGVQQLLQLRNIAITDLERCVRLAPRDAEAYYVLGRLRGTLPQDRPLALAAFDRAIELKPDDPELLARCYLERAALHDSAVKRMADYDAAHKLAPHDPAVLSGRAACLLQQRRAAEALDDLNAALQLDAQDAATHHLRGLTLIELRRWDDALASFTRAIELDPDAHASYVQRARVLLAQGRGREALHDVNQILASAQPTAELLLLRAAVYRAVGEAQRAMGDVELAQRIEPSSAAVARAKAALLAESGQLTEATTVLEQFHTQHGQQPDTLEFLAALYLDQRRFEAAIGVLNALARQLPNSAQVYQMRGDAHLRTGRHVEALRDYNAALELEIKRDGQPSSHLLNNLAWLLATSPDEKVRDGRRAVRLATQACEITGYRQSHILSTLAAGHAELGDFASAVAWARKAIELADDAQRPVLERELQSYLGRQPFREIKHDAPQVSSDPMGSDIKMR
jgi:tetratricopeptide (TPR) repeat protein